MPRGAYWQVQEDSGGLQAVDDEGIAAALRPALEAVRGGAHKQRAPDCAHDKCTGAQQLFLRRYTSAWIHTSMATIAVSLLEKEKNYGEAVELLQQLLGE